MAVSVDPYLRQARSCLLTHAKEVASPQDAWSAAYQPLTILLGKSFAEALRRSRELEHDYQYVGAAFAADTDKRTNDHVVPLKCIISVLIGNPDIWSGEDGVADLKKFIIEHLVLANIPKSLDRKLSKSTMPDQQWFHKTDQTFTAEQKQKAMWSRYASIPGLVLPHDGSDNFIKVATVK